MYEILCQMEVNLLRLLRYYIGIIRKYYKTFVNRLFILTCIFSALVISIPFVFPQLEAFKDFISLALLIYVVLNVVYIGRRIISASFLETREEVYDAAIEVTNQAKEIKVLGPLQTVLIQKTKDGESRYILEKKENYLNTIQRMLVSGVTYKRAINFNPDWNDKKNIDVLAENAAFFAGLLNTPSIKDRANLHIYHCKDLPRMHGEFHYNTSENATLILLGGGIKKELNSGIYIRDKAIATTFLQYFEDTIIDTCIELTAKNLGEMHEYLENGDKKSFNDLLSNLESKIDKT